MNRYLLDVRLCKHKKIVGGVCSVFRAYEAQNLDIPGYNSRIKREKFTSVCGYFRSLAIVFLTPLFELKYRKRMIPIKLHELTTREALDVMIRFKSHAIGRRISTF